MSYDDPSMIEFSAKVQRVGVEVIGGRGPGRQEWGGGHVGVGVKIDYVCRAAQVLSGWARRRLFPNDKADMMALCAGDNYAMRWR